MRKIQSRRIYEIPIFILYNRKITFYVIEKSFEYNENCQKIKIRLRKIQSRRIYEIQIF